MMRGPSWFAMAILVGKALELSWLILPGRD